MPSKKSNLSKKKAVNTAITTKQKQSVSTATKRKADKKTNDKVKEAKLSSTEADTEASAKLIQFKGLVPVDSECAQCCNSFHVFISGDNIYNAMLNQTNIGQNNNKYYLLQLLEHNSKPEYCVWFRWGRVGKTAGTNLQFCPLNQAIVLFEKKFKEKTSNCWTERKSFTKYPQKYDLLQIDYGESQADNKENFVKHGDSKLHEKIQEVMNLLFNLKEFEQCVKEMKYDIKKAPLGKLTEKQIKDGYLSLKKIEKCFEKSDFGKAIQNACSEFYTRIPHDFGMKRPPLINSPQEIKLKLQLLEALSDIKIAISVMDHNKTSCENPLDSNYKSLKCVLSPLTENHEEYQIIKKYVENTHAPTHTSYTLNIINLFAVQKEEIDVHFLKGIGNRMLLWHGSRMTNWCGILKDGLKIAPPEAPTTGYMFGKGIYFADMVSKSANYCFASVRQPIGFLLLCEVALGSISEKLVADYEADKLPSGKHSTKGLGKTAPNPKQTISLNDGTIVPVGAPISVSNAKDSSLLYNEYIVYNVKQIRPRFLVQVKFTFSSKW